MLRGEEGDPDLEFGPRAIDLLLEEEGLTLRHSHPLNEHGVGGHQVVVAYGNDCDGEPGERLVIENSPGEWALMPITLEAFESAVTEAKANAREAFERAHPHEVLFRTHDHAGEQIYFVDAEGVLNGAELRMRREAGTDPTLAGDWNIELTPRRNRDMALARALYQLVAAEGGTLVEFNGGQRSRALWIDENAERAAGLNQDAHPGPYRTTVHYTLDGETHTRSVEAVLPEGEPSGRAESWEVSFLPV